MALYKLGFIMEQSGDNAEIVGQILVGVSHTERHQKLKIYLWDTQQRTLTALSKLSFNMGQYGLKSKLPTVEFQ